MPSCRRAPQARRQALARPQERASGRARRAGAGRGGRGRCSPEVWLRQRKLLGGAAAVHNAITLCNALTHLMEAICTLVGHTLGSSDLCYCTPVGMQTPLICKAR